ncbi:MAG: GHKL domain-containing protein, partial [Ruminiclostridium sp.]|nr:GHKL domain-containing protein [Ruminiclostridium sp.]
SEYIGRAESAGCKVTQVLKLPEMLPFEEKDVCLVLANTVDNAINACSEFSEEKRYINISAEYADGHRLLVSVENPCSRSLEFDKNGMPIIEGYSDEHGIGLRSVKRIVEKYNGFMRCMLENGRFMFQAALFYDNNTLKSKSVKVGALPKRAASSLLGLGLGVIVMLNVLPSAAEAVSELLSVNIRTVRSLNLGWGDNSISIDKPEFDGNNGLNGAVEKYTDEAKEKFLWYFNRRYNGYVAEDMKYTVIRDDEKYYIVQFNVTVNAGGSMDYSRWIVYDKSLGRVLELPDLFKEGSDYIKLISAEILKQMKEKNELFDTGFFVEGDDAFTEISGDANFYIDSFDRLVIVFDEYEVAPGSAGSPEFFIPNTAVEEIVR